MLEMERQAAEVPHQLNSSGTGHKRYAFSRLPRIPTLRRLVHLLFRIHLIQRFMVFTGTPKGVNSFNTTHVKMQVFMVMYLSYIRKGIPFQRGYMLHGVPRRYYRIVIQTW